MAVKNTKSRPDIRSAAVRFHSVVDGNEVFADLEDAAAWLALHGVEVISPRQGILDGGYRPVSRIEKLLDERFPGGGANCNDLVFAVEKDGYETLVFEHGGQMTCSDWVFDRESGRLEFVAVPDVSLKLEEVSRNLRPFAGPTDEVLTGALAREFVFRSKWDAALDFKVDGWPEFRGLRYKKVGGEEVVHAMLMDGTNGSLTSFGIVRALQLEAGLARVQRKIDRTKKWLDAPVKKGPKI